MDNEQKKEDLENLKQTQKNEEKTKKEKEDSNSSDVKEQEDEETLLLMQQKPPSDPSKIIKFGLSVIFILFVIIGGWMSTAPLATSIVAVGEVSADTNKKTIQHLEGGIVDAIYVKNGDVVKKGQVLLKLRDVQIKAQLDILNSQYQEAIALLARLEAQKNDKEKIDFPPELTNKAAIKDQENIFYTTKKSIEDEKSINKNRILQLQKQIEGLNSLIDSKEKRLESLYEEKKEWESLYAQKLVDKQKIREIKREINSIDGDIANSKSQIAKLNEQIEELQNQQLLREKEFKNETLKKYVETKSKVSDLKSKIIANEDKLARTAIKAPINGTVVGLEIHTVGGVIQPGKPILEIVPENAKLVIVAKVETKDIDKVKTGLLSDIRFSAFNRKDVDVIEGEVIYVSADSFKDPSTNIPYYEVKIGLTKKGEDELKQYGFVLIPGMPAEVMIKVGDRTMLEYLIKPLKDMLVRSFNEE